MGKIAKVEDAFLEQEKGLARRIHGLRDGAYPLMSEEIVMNTAGVIDFQIGLEERISKIYGMIGKQFSTESPEDAEWVTLWRELSVDEQNHASLLSN